MPPEPPSPPATPGPRAKRRGAEAVLAAGPGALVVVFSFNAGGFFPGITALVAVGLAFALLVRITTVRHPAEALSVPWVAAAALLSLFAIWTLASSAWSDAPARAVLEYDRALSYLLAFVVFGSLGRTPRGLRWMLRGLALGIVVVCVCALVTRLAPDVWRVPPSLAPDRLSYPLTYWNAMGLLAALGVVFAFGLTTDGRESRIVRVVAAAAVPVVCSALLLSFSRGAIVAGATGLVLLLLLARPSLVLTGLVAVGPAAAIALSAALKADLLNSPNPTSSPAIAEGHELALTLGLCAAGAALMRALMLVVDPWFARLRAPRALRRRRVLVPLGATLAMVVAIAFVAVDGLTEVDRQVDRFTADSGVPDGSDRLTSVSNNGRLDPWRVALDAFRAEPLHGQGAGTWALEWDQRRPKPLQVEDGHSLWFEVLGELGLVGLALVVGALLLIAGGLMARARGPERGPAAVLCAGVLAWALHAGVDWDWEMPALTMWVFAAGGVALAAAPASQSPDAPRRTVSGLLRVVGGLGCLLLALTPLAVVRSDGALRDAQRAFARGDCREAIDRALTASSAMSSRPEPWFIVGVCDVRAGYGRLAVAALDKAVARDPANWEYHYGSALVRGASGLDPRPSARRALALNPRSSLAATAVRRFATERPEAWRQRALTSVLPAD